MCKGEIYMEKREIEVMWNYYYGMSKLPSIGKEELEILDSKNIIRRIYEVIDNEYNETWYLIRDKNERSYVLKSKIRNTYTKDIIKKYISKYNFYQLTTDCIKIYDKGFFPIVAKVSEEILNNLEENKNLNNFIFNNYYCYCKLDDVFKAVRIYRNKAELEVFTNEDDAIYWCFDFSITKEDILKNNIRPLNQKERVYEYKLEKG